MEVIFTPMNVVLLIWKYKIASMEVFCFTFMEVNEGFFTYFIYRRSKRLRPWKQKTFMGVNLPSYVETFIGEVNRIYFHGTNNISMVPWKFRSKTALGH